MNAPSRPSVATLYIVRHGSTAANKQRYAGWDDEPLDDAGRAEAERLAVRLADRRIDAIYASPLSRARDTALPLARRTGLTIDCRHDLIEMNFGELQGMSKAASTMRIRKSHLHVAIPGGESLADVALRAERFLNELRPRLVTGSTLVLVSHFWTCRVLLGLLLGRRIDDMFAAPDYKPSTGSVLQVNCTIAGTGEFVVHDRNPIASDAATHEVPS